MNPFWMAALRRTGQFAPRERLHTGRLILGFFFFASLAIYTHAAAIPLTLEEAIAWAVQGNRTLVASGLQVQAEGIGAEQIREQLRGVSVIPQGSGGLGSETEEWSAGLGIEKTISLGTKISLSGWAEELSSNQADPWRREVAKVEVSQPLFRNFGSLMQDEAIVSANEHVRALRRAWEREKSSLVLRVVDGYEQLIYLMRQLLADEATAGRMERLLLLTRAKEGQGRATRTDVLRVELQRGQAESRIEAGRIRVDVHRREFVNLLGLPLETELELTEPSMIELQEIPPEEALAVALEERVDYAQAIDMVQTKKRHARIARREVLPDVRVQGSYSRYGEGNEWGDAGAWDEEDWFVGLSANMNMNLRSALLGVSVADLDVDAQREAVVILQYALACDITEKWSAYRLSRTELELASQNRQLAANRAELARVMFANGKGYGDSVSDAEEDFIQAELVELQARKAASVAAYDVLHSMGTLVPVPDVLKAGKQIGMK